MIVKMHKVLLYGAKEEMDRFFEMAQRSGFLEFIGIWHKKALELPESAKNSISAIKILRNWVGSGLEGFEWLIPEKSEDFAKEVVQLNASLERHFEEKRLLTAEIARIAPFGEFSKSDIEAIQKEGNRFVQFFCRKSDLAHDLELPQECIFVGTEYDLDYYIAINKERVHYPKMIEILIDKPVQELRKILKETQKSIGMMEARLRYFANKISFLHEGLVEGLNEHHLRAAKHDASYPLSEVLFAVEAYVPESHLKALHSLLGSLTVFCEEIKMEPGERIPTCMENSGAGKIGEDLVHIYDTPSTTDQDPSTWILIFFSLFFAMIISDAGYGLIYLSLGLFLKWKYRQVTGIAKRMIKLLVLVGITTTIWGGLTASFFGIEVDPKSSYREFFLIQNLALKKAEYVLQEKGDLYQRYVQDFPAVKNATNAKEFLLAASQERDGETYYVALRTFSDDFLMEFSLIVGILHLSISFLRYAFRNFSGLGWIVFMIGGYLFLPVSVLDATSIIHYLGILSKETAYLWGKQLLFGGFGLAVFASMVQNGVLKGLMEPLQGIQVFGDVLSYLRLYALGLAGVIVASTFNFMGVKFGPLAGIFIVISGHALNIALSSMAGVVHGLRLNFLEWYHYCFEGGGKRFNPLRLYKK